ncbi:hypothetical protein [Shewanella algae]|uniref:hypothetical protein n=1 Tax=Shewanella algae TaxID=38313 RepID=UPI0031F545A6
MDADSKVQNVGQCCRSNIVDLRHGGVYTTAPVGTDEGERQARELMASHPCARRMM